MMIQKKYSKMVKTAAMGLVLATILNATSVFAASVNRVGGDDRYSTARSVAESMFSNSENVVLVSGEGYADAVSATPLATKLNAPILLTASKELSAGVLQTIKNVGGKNVYIVGGEGAVSQKIENLLKTNGLNVIRKSGGNRFATNVEVARELIKRQTADGKEVKEAILVNGQDSYADALSVASVAAKLGIPLIITNSKGIDVEVKKLVDEFGLTVKAVGGEIILPDAVINSVKGTRIAKGKNRFNTNLSILNHYKDILAFDKVYVATGGNDNVKNFADALVGSAAAAKFGAPLILSGNIAKEEDMSAYEDFIKGNINKSSNVVLIGKTGALSQTVENRLAKIAEEISEEDLEIISID